MSVPNSSGGEPSEFMSGESDNNDHSDQNIHSQEEREGQDGSQAGDSQAVNPPQDPAVDPPLAPVVIPPPNSVPHPIDVNVVIQPAAHQTNYAGSSVQCSDDIVLDAVILDLLGKRLVLDRTLAPAVHNDIVVRWEEILKKGLPNEERDKILKKYPPPNNCLVIDTPKLNSVVKTSLQDLTLKKDDRIRVKQEKITACLAAVSMILSKTIKNYTGPQKKVE